MRAELSRVDGWNHNTHYHARLLAAVPHSCHRALDVGCGRGTFARRLSAVSAEVEAIDTDRGVIAQARALSADVPNVRFVTADVLTWRTDRPYDFVSMIAVLHHLPLGETLTAAARLLRPGGVLAVLGLARPASVAHAAAQSLVAYPLSRYHRLLRTSSDVGAAVAEPAMTLAAIREQAGAILPGAVIRRHVLWRYSLIWTRPA